MGERVVGERVLGERVVGERVVGERVVGERVVGERPLATDDVAVPRGLLRRSDRLVLSRHAAAGREGERSQCHCDHQRLRDVQCLFVGARVRFARVLSLYRVSNLKSDKKSFFWWYLAYQVSQP